MIKTEWGRSLTGAQILALRDVGLPDNIVNYEQGSGQRSILVPIRRGSYYCLPADHIAYKVIGAGWLDKPNLRLWFGGELSPRDWDGGNVLLRNGSIFPGENIQCWDHMGYDGDVIGYISKDITKSVTDNEPDTVTIAKMTEAELNERMKDKEWANPNHSPHAYKQAFHDLGLIKPKPEPTREERFWESVSGFIGSPIPSDVKVWVKKALEFER